MAAVGHHQMKLGETEPPEIEAIRRVEVNAEAVWMAQAALAIRLCAGTQPWGFTTDDVWLALKWMDAKEPHERRAMGAAIRKAVSSGLIESTGEYRKSTRSENHSRPIRVWKAGDVQD